MPPTESRSRPESLTASVVVPNFNYAQYIQETLDSLAAQDDSDLDVIIVDGGSTDGSLEIIEEWARDHGARWVSEPDHGQSNAINKGIRMARGDIITWINSDDLLEPGSVKRIVGEFSRDPELDFVWGFCLLIDQDGNPLRIGNPDIWPDLALLRRTRCFVRQPGTWWRRSLHDRFGELDESYRYTFDYEFFLRIAGQVKARFLPQIVSRFRLHPRSKTVNERSGFMPEQWRAFRSHGGRLASPFVLDAIRNYYVMPALWRMSQPFRRLLWKMLGLKPGERVRI